MQSSKQGPALSILGQIDTQKAVIMLGIGVACAGIVLLDKKDQGRQS